MAITTITGLTAQRMIQIEQASVTSGRIEGDNLVLVTRGGTPITAGNVRGPQGPPGDPGGVVDATTTMVGGVRLAGNLKGSANDPRVTGVLDNTVNVSAAQATGTYNSTPTTLSVANIIVRLMEITAQYLKKSGTATTVWSGTEAQYNSLPAATRNAAGFIAVVSP